MSAVLVDSSVAIKWFHAEREPEVEEARAILSAHVGGEIDACILDLALYEVGNVLIRALQWPPDDVADQLDRLVAICGAPIACARDWLRAAAGLASAHSLTFYDGAWAAAAAGLRIPLVSADKQLLASGLAESATGYVRRVGLKVD